MSDLSYKIIVGLEIHVQLDTKTKIFCGCPIAFGGEPNTRVCPVCIGMPGVMPVMNKKAYEYSVLAGLALNCNIPSFTKWDRKSYYYPDLPKNYQISQYDLPMSEHGYIEIPLEGGETKKIRILRAHLEEDAGKNIHTLGNFSAVDLNRAGTPLLEIVTEPDMNNGAEVKSLAVELQRIVRYLGISLADMQKGHMRFEPNINLHITKDGKVYETPISEVKNLNSFRALEGSVAYEARRQLDDFIEHGTTMETGAKATYGWDDVNMCTVLQRIKEAAHDYRYFPEPDLVPIVMNEQWLDEIKKGLCELPIAKQLRFVTEYKLSDYDAGVLTADRATGEFFDAAVAAGATPKRVCNLITQVGAKLANEAGCGVAELGVDAAVLGKLAKMVDDSEVSASASATIFEEMVKTKKAPEVIAEEMNLVQKSDAGELEGLVKDVLAANEKAVAEATGGGKKAGKARGFLLGQVMQKTRGQANPKIVGELLDKLLG